MKEDDFAPVIGAVLAFLLPVGIYCFLLAVINRRSRPLMVRGIWDTAGLFLASSGFVFVTVPLLFNQYYSRALADGGNEPFEDIWLRHWLLSLSYYIAVVVVGVLVMLWRSDQTAIYNIDTEHFTKGLDLAAEALGMLVEMHGNRAVLKPPPEPVADGAMRNAATKLLPYSMERYAEIIIEPFPAMCHMTLYWCGGPRSLRQSFEAELDKGLAESAPVENTASGWFFSISGLVFGSVTMICVVLALLAFLPPRR